MEAVHDDIGRGSFLAVYFASGALSSYFSLTVNVLQRFLVTTSVGSSGAIMGVIAAWLAYHSEYVPPTITQTTISRFRSSC